VISKSFTPKESGVPRAVRRSSGVTDAGAGRLLRWSLDIVERCSVQWAEAMGFGLECRDSTVAVV
jgi:hypothetical protein